MPDSGAGCASSPSGPPASASPVAQGRAGSCFVMPSLRRVARILTAEPSTLQPKERQYLDHLLATSAPVALAQDLALRFAAIVRERNVDEFGR